MRRGLQRRFAADDDLDAGPRQPVEDRLEAAAVFEELDDAAQALARGKLRGVYYVRVRARNEVGGSGPSTEIAVVVP